MNIHKLAFHLILSGCLVQLVGYGVEAYTTDPLPVPPVIDLPVAPVPTPEPVPPVPAPATALTGDQVYPVRASGKCKFFVHPDGLVTVTSEEVKAGERFRQKANYVDTGLKTRTWTGPCYVYFVEATGKGKVYIDIVPYGDFKDDSQIKSFALDVDSGLGPRPPPGPTPDPPKPPTPDVKPPINDPGFKVMFVYDGAVPLRAQQYSAMYGDAVAKYVTSKGDARSFRSDTDPSTIPEPWKSAFLRKRDSLPWVIISNGKTGYEGPVPDNLDASLTLLKKFGG